MSHWDRIIEAARRKDERELVKELARAGMVNLMPEGDLPPVLLAQCAIRLLGTPDEAMYLSTHENRYLNHLFPFRPAQIIELTWRERLSPEHDSGFLPGFEGKHTISVPKKWYDLHLRDRIARSFHPFRSEGFDQ